MELVMEHIVLPELGEGIENAKIACWHVAEGDHVLIDDDILEVVTDKATFNIASEVSGIVKEIRIKEGQSAGIGEILAVINVTGTKGGVE